MRQSCPRSGPVRDQVVRGSFGADGRPGVMPRQHLETKAGADERACIRVSEAKPPRHVMNGVGRGPAATNGAKHLAHNTLDTGRCPWAKSEDDVDRLCRRPLPAPPDIAIDFWPEAAVSRRRLLLRFSCPAVGGEGEGIRKVRPGLDPLLSIWARTHDRGVLQRRNGSGQGGRQRSSRRYIGLEQRTCRT